ncbi:MAG: gas vesicle protein [Pseudomonadota bacterium]
MSGNFDATLVGDHPLEETTGTTLVDVLDRLLDRGVVLRAEVWLTVADIELVFVGADVILCSPETIQAHRRGDRAYSSSSL